jgi:hypothetical protein
LTLKYVNDVFNEHLPRTVNASYLEKEVTLSDSNKVKLAIWVKHRLMTGHRRPGDV